MAFGTLLVVPPSTRTAHVACAEIPTQVLMCELRDGSGVHSSVNLRDTFPKIRQTSSKTVRSGSLCALLRLGILLYVLLLQC